MKKRKKDVVSGMFLPAAIVMIFTQVTGVVANIIDGIVTSRFLGADAYSSVSLLGPMVNIILVFAGFVSVGGQIVCSNKIGMGEREEANAVFSFSIVFGVLLAVLFILFGSFFPGILFRVCGVSIGERPELYEYMLRYLHGYLFGVPAVILVQILGPFLVMDNAKKLVSLSATVLCISDIIGDLLNALFFRGGIFGMGLATAAAVWLQFLLMSTHFIRKSGYFRFSLHAFTVTHFVAIAKSGSLSFVKRLATILRDLGTNRINLYVAVSTAAVAAKGMQNDLNMFMFCISIGIGQTLLTISSMYYGASDKEGLKRAFSYAMSVCAKITSVVAVIIFLAAPFLARIYTSAPEVLSLSVFSIRCMALGLCLDGIIEAYQDYLQGIQNRKLVNILCFTERFFIPVGMAFLLGMLFGSKGIMASVAAGKLLLVLIMLVVFCVRCKGIPGKVEDVMFLPENFGGKTQDNIYSGIMTMEEVVRESERAAAFCLAHGVDKRHANQMALFVEEMAGNIVRHGRSRNKNGICVDYRLYAGNGKICLSLRDYCEEFDPMKYYGIHKDQMAESNIGIRMVMKMAQDIRYINTFNSNCLLIFIDWTTADR